MSLVRTIINWAFGLIAVGLYAVSASLILLGAFRTEGFNPSNAQGTLFGLTAGAVVAFLVAQLGLAAANKETTTGNSLRAAVSGEANSGKGEWLLGVIAAIYILVGLMFVILWLSPGLLATGEDGKKLTAPPAYVASEAQAFVGVVLAGFAALAAALKS
jgi:hypothetical protein